MLSFDDVLNIQVAPEFQGTQFETSIRNTLTQFEQTSDGQDLISALRDNYSTQLGSGLDFIIDTSVNNSHFNPGGTFDNSLDDSLTIDPRTFTDALGQFETDGFWDALTGGNRQPFSVQRTVFHELYHAAASHRGGPDAEIRAIEATNLFLEKYYGIERFRDEFGHANNFQNSNHSMVDLEEAFNALGYNQDDIQILERILQDFDNIQSGDSVIQRLFGFFETESCFGAGTPVDMWPLDKSLKPGPDGVYDQETVRAKIWQKPIEEVSVGDLVVSFDDAGNLVPGYVPRIMTNDVKILLNFFGTRVTPGHVYYRADSNKAHKFETLIDILRDDGVIQKQDGTLIRATTNVPVGDPRDGYVKASTGIRCADGSLDEKDQGRIRLGTRFIVGEGKDRKHWSVSDVIEHAGGVVGDDEMIRVGDGPPMAFHWEFSDTLPKPEDFVLEASGTTLEAIYKAAEWESQQPQMPAPMVMDGGPVQPLPHKALSAMPRNEPLNLSSTPVAKPQQALNRKQRKAMEAKQRKAGKTKRMVS